MFADRELGIVVGQQAKSSEKLSSGYRINRAADDAAGLSISEKMRRQIRGLTQASKNAQDGISLVQIADGALNESQDMLQRMNELAVKAANGTLQAIDRDYIDFEIQKLKEEITATARKTTFNEIQSFPADGYSPREAAGLQNVVASQEYRLSIGEDGKITVSDPMTSVNPTSVSAADGWQDLAKHIAGELIPNAVSQILDKFPSLKTKGDNIDISLKVEYVDGKNGTLAFAQFGYYNNGAIATPASDSFLIKVDSSDFSDATLGTDAEEMLESTLTHELTHTIMQNTMTTGMAKSFPEWFKEGTAQLSGGGFTTGWNEYLQRGLEGITDPSDTSKDDWLRSKLQSRTVESNVYGHGYLAAAYLGQLASGSAEVSANNIAAGMDKIFARLLNNGNDLDAAIRDVVGGSFNSASDVARAINNADPDALDFVKKLVLKTKDGSDFGAGSVVAPGGLSKGGSSIVGNSAPEYTGYTVDTNVMLNGRELILQVGSENETQDQLKVKMFKMSADDLGLKNTNVKTQTDAQSAITDVKKALQMVSCVRSYYGATQNRLEHLIKNLDNVVENTTGAESLIRDTDMPEEMVRYSNRNILMQAGQSMLAQANQSKQGILSMLG